MQIGLFPSRTSNTNRTELIPREVCVTDITQAYHIVRVSAILCLDVSVGRQRIKCIPIVCQKQVLREL